MTANQPKKPGCGVRDQLVVHQCFSQSNSNVKDVYEVYELLMSGVWQRQECKHKRYVWCAPKAYYLLVTMDNRFGVQMHAAPSIAEITACKRLYTGQQNAERER